MKVFLRFFTGLLVVSLLAGCASVFEDPYYVELEPVPEVVSVAAMDFEPLEEESVQTPGLSEPVEAAVQPVYPDIWSRVRAGFAVDGWQPDRAELALRKRYATDGLVVRIAERSSGFLYYVVDAVERRKLPMELVLVPFVESGYSLNAVSSAEAHGAWQFIKRTARTYELGIDHFRDERRNLVASTRAALDYLSKLHGMFGDWSLAMAAYNCGEGRVEAELLKARRKGISQPGWKHIAASLPLETREYVPRIMAMKALIADPGLHGIRLPEIANEPMYTVVGVHRDIDVDLLARLAGMSVDQLLRLNASLRAPVIVGRHDTRLLLPHAAAGRLAEAMTTHAGPWVSWRTVRLTRAATAAEIAGRNRIPVARFLRWNPLPEGQVYEVGTTIFLPGKGREALDVSELPAKRLLTQARLACSAGDGC